MTLMDKVLRWRKESPEDKARTERAWLAVEGARAEIDKKRKQENGAEA